MNISNHKRVIDPLHQFIKALSRTEKRYFKVYAARHTIGNENNYVKLFDALDKQTEYNETLLQKKFKDEKFAKRLTVAKAYLYETLLKCLTQYHTQQSLQAQISESLISVSFLYEKGLLQQAQKLLSRTQKQVHQFQLLHLVPDIIHWHRKLIEAQHYTEIQDKKLHEIIQLGKDNLDNLHNILEYWRLQSELYITQNKMGMLRQSQDLIALSNILNSPLLNHNAEPKTYEAKALNLKVYATYFFMIRDYTSAFRYIQELLSHIELYPDLIKSDARLYINTLLNALNLSDALQQHHLHFDFLQKVATFQDKSLSDSLQMQVMEGYYYHILKQNLRTKKYNKLQNILTDVDDFLSLYEGRLNNVSVQMIGFYAAKNCYDAKIPTKAIGWLQRISADEFRFVRQDVFLYSHLLLAIVSKGTVRKNALLRAFKLLKTRQTLSLLESFIAVTINSLKTINTEKDWKLYLQEKHKEFKKIIEDPLERKALAYIDFEQWYEETLT